jgi:uncharacterized protein YbjT (DUF2867 family)
MTPTDNLILVTGGTGTIGRRVVAQLRNQGVPVRPASRHTDPPLDWSDPASWEAALDGAKRLYLLLPDYTELPDAFHGPRPPGCAVSCCTRIAASTW